jgi:hypothetical protein
MAGVSSHQQTIIYRKTEISVSQGVARNAPDRNIAALVIEPIHVPRWVDPGVPPGSQADQFLHAHYFHRTFEGRRAKYEEWYVKNAGRKQAALTEAIA